MENILNFSEATIVNKVVPKKSFYVRSGDPHLREALTQEFESIVWMYKLAPSTINVDDGELVHEIAVFYCKMKEEGYHVNSFAKIDAMLPRHTIFVIEYGGLVDIMMHHKRMVEAKGEKRWVCDTMELKRNVDLATLRLTIEGLSMDSIYHGFLSQISGLKVTNETEYKEQTELRKQIAELQRHIEALQKRIRLEKQFNRQMEMNGEVRKLKQELKKLETTLKN